MPARGRKAAGKAKPCNSQSVQANEMHLAQVLLMLPLDVLQRAFGKSYDFKYFRLVSKETRQLCNSLQTTAVFCVPRASDAHQLRAAAGFHKQLVRLSRLTLSGNRKAGSALFTNSSPKDKALSQYLFFLKSPLEKVTTVHLTSVKNISLATTISFPQVLPALKHLVFDDCTFSDTPVFEALVPCSKLETLELLSKEDIALPQQALASLFTVTSLRALHFNQSISCNNGVGDPELAGISMLTNLTSLRAPKQQVLEAEAQELGHLLALRQLEVGELWHEDEDILDEVVRPLSTLVNLTSLSMPCSSNWLTEDGLSALEACTKLTRLTVAGFQLTEGTLNLPCLSSVRQLELRLADSGVMLLFELCMLLRCFPNLTHFLGIEAEAEITTQASANQAADELAEIAVGLASISHAEAKLTLELHGGQNPSLLKRLLQRCPVSTCWGRLDLRGANQLAADESALLASSFPRVSHLRFLECDDMSSDALVPLVGLPLRVLEVTDCQDALEAEDLVAFLTAHPSQSLRLVTDVTFGEVERDIISRFCQYKDRRLKLDYEDSSSDEEQGHGQQSSHAEDDSDHEEDDGSDSD